MQTRPDQNLRVPCGHCSHPLGYSRNPFSPKLPSSQVSSMIIMFLVKQNGSPHLAPDKFEKKKKLWLILCLSLLDLIWTGNSLLSTMELSPTTKNSGPCWRARASGLKQRLTRSASPNLQSICSNSNQTLISPFSQRRSLRSLKERLVSL